MVVVEAWTLGEADRTESVIAAQATYKRKQT
jgi:hypothetical protein